MIRNELHERNRHNGEYDFVELVAAYPCLERFVAPNKFGRLSINFFDSAAVKALNKALLICYYGVDWDIPEGSLCPPIPGRADYIHYIADLIGMREDRRSVRCLDIGVGANCIFPIIGVTEYGWSFVATDISMESMANAQKIVDHNACLKDRIELRRQSDNDLIFSGIIQNDEFFDVTLCNPPFHSSRQRAERGTLRKLSNLKGSQVKSVSLNFGGQDNELWCDGGELRFVCDMIRESRSYSKNCGWFTTLVSSEDNLSRFYRELKAIRAAKFTTIQMRQGNKCSRILAWKF